MAVDTRAKRESAILVAIPWRTMPPPPSGTINGSERQASAFIYSGIASNANKPVSYSVTTLKYSTAATTILYPTAATTIIEQ